MGLRRPLLLITGALVVAAGLWSTRAVAGEATPQTVVRGEVAATGAPMSGAERWHVERTAPGTYRVDLSDGRGSLEVAAWDEVADVTVLPLADGDSEIRFSLDRRPIDTAFSFVAVVER